MPKDRSSACTIVLPRNTGGTVAYDRRSQVWWTETGDRLTFRHPSLRYTDQFGPLLQAFLCAPDGKVLSVPWNDVRHGRTSLASVVWGLRKAFNDVLRCTPAPHEVIRKLDRDERGYQLSELYIKSEPEWVARMRLASGLSLGAVEQPSSDEFPTYHWIDELVSAVSEGQWVRVQHLAGNGSEDVTHILRTRLPADRVFTFDATSLSPGQDLLERLAEEVDFSGATTHSPHHSSIAQALAGNHAQLLIVVSRLGRYHQLHGQQSLKRLVLRLQEFTNVERPRVTLAVLLPVRLSHLLDSGDGSIMNLHPITPGASDADTLAVWAGRRMQGLPANELEKLIQESCGQLAALRAAIRLVSRPQPERVRAIHEAHISAAEAILGTLGECCRDLLENRRASPSLACIEALQTAGILDRQTPSLGPVIRSWGDVWQREGGAL